MAVGSVVGLLHFYYCFVLLNGMEFGIKLGLESGTVLCYLIVRIGIGIELQLVVRLSSLINNDL